MTPERALDQGLARNAMRLENLAQALTGDSHAQLLAGTLRERLASLAGEYYHSLLSFARPDEQTLDCWSNASADLDMALVRTKGRNQQTEMELDDTLEEIREYPDRTRRAAWTWRELNCTLRSLSALDVSSLAERIAEDAVSLLRESRELLSGLTSTIDPQREPGHFRHDELTALHRVLQVSGALERVGNHLAVGLIENLSPEVNLNSPARENLELCASMDLPSGTWSRLCEIVAPVSLSAVPAEEFKTAGTSSASAAESSPDESSTALENMRLLVGNMALYLKALNDAGGTGGPFGRVVVRQKEIFAVKVSLLLNSLSHNGSGPCLEALELAARAVKLAGAAWDYTKNLRLAALPGETS